MPVFFAFDCRIAAHCKLASILKGVDERVKANITEFQTPTGAKGNILNPRDWIGLILGGFMLLATFGIAQNVARTVTNRFPIVDTNIEKPWVNMPAPAATNSEVVY
jgi:hypothetical protein